MFIYYLYFFTLNIFNYFNILKPNKFNKSIFIFFALFIALLGGLRSLQTGFDNWAYIDYFNNNHEIDFKDSIPFLVDNMEIGYFFINILTFFVNTINIINITTSSYVSSRCS